MLVAAFAALAVKLLIAAATSGTNDVRHFQRYADVVGRVGPYAVYTDPGSWWYNHGPITGFLLSVIAWVRDLGIPVRFTIRAIPSLADIGTVLLVFAVARRSWTLRRATLLAVAVAVTPVLLFISGFHGNTDPLLAFLVLLAVYLLHERAAPFAAGAAFGAALSVKLVPVVVLPALLFAVRSRRDLVRLTLGIGVVAGALWAPAVVGEWPGVRQRVLGYVAPYNGWGVLEVARRFGSFRAADDVLRGPFVYLLLAIAAGVGSLVSRSHPRRGYAGVAAAFIAFLFVSPGWGAQYLAWIAGIGFVLRPLFGLAYSVVAGATLFAAYTNWSDGLPWDYAQAGRGLGAVGSWLGIATWALLGVWTFVELARVVRARRTVAAPALREPELAAEPG